MAVNVIVNLWDIKGRPVTVVDAVFILKNLVVIVTNNDAEIP